MKQFFTLFLCFALLSLLYSCNKGGIPFYLKMDWGHIAGLSSADISAGDTTHFISDAWVQTSSTNLGAYQMPCEFPVLAQNDVYFLVNAGVWESGQQEVRVPYPFYAPDTFTIDATPTKVYFHHPVFSYIPSAITQCSENFEGGNVYDSMQRVTLGADTNVKYGQACGRITLTSTDSDIVATVLNPSLQANTAFSVSYGSEVWMELDYKSQVPFWIGIIGIYSAGENTSEEVLFALPSPVWTKLYVKLTNVVTGVGASYYYPYFEALDTVGGSGGNLYLDNIKVVHF